MPSIGMRIKYTVAGKQLAWLPSDAAIMHRSGMRTTETFLHETIRSITHCFGNE